MENIQNQKKMADTPDLSSLLHELKKAQEEISELKKADSILTLQIEEERQRTGYARAMESSDKFVLVEDLAKMISHNGKETGELRLFEWLRTHGYLCRTPATWNHPTQRALDMGLLVTKSSYIKLPTGRIIATNTPKVTGKGQAYFF